MAQGLPRRRGEDQVLVRFGSRIRALRRSRGWTQYNLSDRAGLDQTYISLVERGIPNLTFRTVIKLARAFKLPVSRVMG